MQKQTRRPNIIIMYADDLGYGDVGCYGSTHIPTPNIDRLAGGGLVFNQAYATAATCTPSRYSLLTGSYPWRNKKAHILPGDAPMIIPPGSQTLPKMLKDAGYATGVVGKWHLGLGAGNLDYNQEINPCPLDVGFDYSFIMAATNDRVPCVYIEGRRVVGLDQTDPIEVSYGQQNPFPDVPTGREHPELLRMKHSHGHDMSIINGIGRIGYMRGGRSALWEDEEMAEVFLCKASSFITEHQDRPFFLYYALHQPHVPRVPGPRFAGRSGLGPRGDVIMELDWCVGQILDVLEQQGLMEDTLIIFTSDNGPVLDDGYQDQAVELNTDHLPTGPLRGGKYSMYDGGTRVPFILTWQGTVNPGKSPALICQVDLLATFASLVGELLEDDGALDSLDVLDAMLGRDALGRRELITEGIGTKTVLRCDDWVFIPPYQGPAVSKHTGIEMGNSPEAQLYHLGEDMGQRANLAAKHPDIAERMSTRLAELLASSRTRPV
ncbi:MAG: arylsulfatase [Limnochordia bacterium]|nr:arylsulfatase [Limnochordia bacterium]